jgi:hypothetical protein
MVCQRHLGGAGRGGVLEKEMVVTKSNGKGLYNASCGLGVFLCAADAGLMGTLQISRGWFKNGSQVSSVLRDPGQASRSDDEITTRNGHRKCLNHPSSCWASKTPTTMGIP